MAWVITYNGLTPTLAHFHGPAAVGVNASPVAGTPSGLIAAGAPGASPIQGTATITVEQMGQLQAGNWYINLHTAAISAGEIRGQVVLQQADGGTDGGDAASDAPADVATDTPTDVTTDTPTDRPTDTPTDTPADRTDAAGGTGATGGTGGRGGAGGTGGTTGGAGGRGGSGTGGAGGSTGGAGGRGGAAGRGGTGTTPAAPAEEDDGCGCRTVGGSGSAAGLIGLALAGLLFSARRRRS
jgi:MYXO-CTERM domain-containing protein